MTYSVANRVVVFDVQYNVDLLPHCVFLHLASVVRELRFRVSKVPAVASKTNIPAVHGTRTNCI
jgi:hypothetical protein